MSKNILFCEYCSWKIILDEDADVYELKNDTLSNKKYRCKNCGRAVVPRKILDPQKELEIKEEKKKMEEENKKWIKENSNFQVNFLKENQDEQE